MRNLLGWVAVLLWAPWLATPSLAETLYGPGSITVGTNEAILITSRGKITTYPESERGCVFIDGLPVYFFDGHYALAGGHTFTVTNVAFISYQRLQGSAIKTLVINGGSQFLAIPAGKTAQFYTMWNGYNFGTTNTLTAVIYPEGSTNTYRLDMSFYACPSLAGPAVVMFTGSGVASYYFTDEIVQVPPEGLIETVAPAMEVLIEKSNNLTNWTPIGAFNTSAEAGAFYRLKILK